MSVARSGPSFSYAGGTWTAPAGDFLLGSFYEYATIEELAGSLFSAMSPETLPSPRDRPRFQAELRKALRAGTYTEPISVTVISTL